MSAIPILDPSDPEFDRDIASSFLNEIKSKGLKPPLNLDSSSRDYNPTSVIKFLTTLGNLMAKESASVIMGDISGNNITDTPIESNGNKDNMNQRVIGSVMDPLGNIPVLDNAKFIKPFFSQLRRVKTLLRWSDSQVIDAVPLRVKGPLLNFFEDRDSSNIRNLEELEKEMTQAYLPGKTAGKKFRDLAELRQSSRETVYQFYKRVEIATKSYRSGYVGLVGFTNSVGLDCFIEGSRINIKRYLLEHQDDYDSLFEAYKVAQRFEAIENALGEEQEFLSAAVDTKFGWTGQNEGLRQNWPDEKRDQGRGESFSSRGRGQNRNIGRNFSETNYNRNSDFSKTYGDVPFRERGEGSTNRRCYKCQSFSHLVAECPNRVCYSCGNKGHSANFCYKRNNNYQRGARFVCGSWDHKANSCMNRFQAQSSGDSGKPETLQEN